MNWQETIAICVAAVCLTVIVRSWIRRGKEPPWHTTNQCSTWHTVYVLEPEDAEKIDKDKYVYRERK